MRDIKIIDWNSNPRVGARVMHYHPNTIYFCKHKRWILKGFDELLTATLNHELIHCVLIDNNMQEESTAFDKIADKYVTENPDTSILFGKLPIPPLSRNYMIGYTYNIRYF